MHAPPLHFTAPCTDDGGLGMGLHIAGWRVRSAVERNDAAFPGLISKQIGGPLGSSTADSASP